MTTAAPIRVTTPADLPTYVGQRAIGEWFLVDQDRIVAFAEATEDRQWIHVDVDRAASGPFGGPIAHGFLSLSLVPRLTEGLFVVDGAAMAVNYGLDRVRFLRPVPSGSRVRATTELTAAESTSSGIRAASTVTVEIEDIDGPAVIAQVLTLYVPQTS